MKIGNENIFTVDCTTYPFYFSFLGLLYYLFVICKVKIFCILVIHLESPTTSGARVVGDSR
jgi:hypothetical protein